MWRSVFLVAAVCCAQTPKGEPPHVRMEIGSRKEITITFPGYAKEDLVDVATRFFAGEKEGVSPRLRELLSQAPEFTLVLTTKK
jgi:hypothetical protein